MVTHGLADSRNIAQRLVMAGEVSIEGQLVHKPSEAFPQNSHITIANQPKYVSRGGLKLEKALVTFKEVIVEGAICADVGASTGGFTDCLLQQGAKQVYAIDVGYGQLHQSIRNHSDVVVMERTNVKDVDALPTDIDLVTIDVSFISLRRVLPIVAGWNHKRLLQVIALIKPQFEVGRKIAAAGKGVIRNEKDRLNAINAAIEAAQKSGFDSQGYTESPIKGPKGNVEYLLHLTYNPDNNGDEISE